MQSELKPGKIKPARKYPYLGVSEGSGKIVLFRKPDEGTVVNVGASNTFELGERSDYFSEGGYAPYDGSVILSND